MAEEKSLDELMEEELEQSQKVEKEKAKDEKPTRIKTPARIRTPRVSVVKITNEWLESLAKVLEDEDYHKITIIKQILEYTTTEKALHTIGEILQGKSLRRTNKKILANEVKRLIDEKILKIQ